MGYINSPEVAADDGRETREVRNRFHDIPATNKCGIHLYRARGKINVCSPAIIPKSEPRDPAPIYDKQPKPTNCHPPRASVCFMVTLLLQTLHVL